MGRLEPPHVHRWSWPSGQLGVHHHYNVDCSTDRRKDLQLDWNAVERLYRIHDSDDVCPWLRCTVHRWWTQWRVTCCFAVRLPTTRHLLHRRSHPLRPVRRLYVRPLRWCLLLVAEDHRENA